MNNFIISESKKLIIQDCSQSLNWINQMKPNLLELCQRNKVDANDLIIELKRLGIISSYSGFFSNYTNEPVWDSYVLEQSFMKANNIGRLTQLSLFNPPKS